MGTQADDLKNDFSFENRSFKKVKKEYKINIIHKDTMKIFWTEIVKSNSLKGCQTVFRKNYPHIRKQFNSEYTLQVIEL